MRVECESSHTPTARSATHEPGVSRNADEWPLLLTDHTFPDSNFYEVLFPSPTLPLRPLISESTHT